MIANEILNEYFEWLSDTVCGKRYSKAISFRKLLARLHDTDFRWLIPRDRNRAEDGKDLRYRFAITQGYEDEQDYVLDVLVGPCSVLEMLVALALRCEESMMDDPRVGDRTGQWFWSMITSLGLGGMTDDRYNEFYIDDVIDRFLDREYEPDGHGGLFTIRHCDRDLRDVEIWVQLGWYIGSIT